MIYPGFTPEIITYYLKTSIVNEMFRTPLPTSLSDKNRSDYIDLLSVRAVEAFGTHYTLIKKFRTMRRQRVLYKKQLDELKQWQKLCKKHREIPLMPKEVQDLFPTTNAKTIKHREKKNRKAYKKAWKAEKKEFPKTVKEYYEMTWAMRSREETHENELRCEEMQHYFTTQPSYETITERVERWKEMITDLEDEYDKMVGKRL